MVETYNINKLNELLLMVAKDMEEIGSDNNEIAEEALSNCLLILERAWETVHKCRKIAVKLAEIIIIAVDIPIFKSLSKDYIAFFHKCLQFNAKYRTKPIIHKALIAIAKLK